MSSVLSNYGGNLGLGSIFGDSCYLALHLADPTVLGNPATEMAGGGYIRRLMHLSSPSGRSTANTNGFRFTGLPASDVTYLAGWDAISGGNMLGSIELPDTITVTESGQFIVEVGDVAFSL